MAIVKGLEDTTSNEGSDTLLTVELNRPNEEVEWLKDGARIYSGPGNRIYANNNAYYLRINDSSPKANDGVYSFRVKNLETSGRLSVIEKPTEIVSPLKDKVAVENAAVKMEIELNKPDMLERLAWFKDGKEIDFSDDAVKANFEVKATGPKYALCIAKAQFEDEAEYTVKGKDSDLNSSAKLSVEEAPLEFVRHLADVELKENQTAKFECELNKAGETVRWYKNGELIAADDKDVVIKADGKVHSLTLKKVDASNAAKYSARTSGPASNALLYVEEIPIEFIHKLENQTVKERQTATFTCKMNKENALVKWFKGGLEILPNENKYMYVVDGENYSLEILDCQLDDINEYTISFRGRKCSARLEVEGKHENPRIVSPNRLLNDRFSN